MTSPATGRPAHNRRTAYTKTAIRRTFFELLEEKDFDKISVRRYVSAQTSTEAPSTATMTTSTR